MISLFVKWLKANTNIEYTSLLMVEVMSVCIPSQQSHSRRLYIRHDIVDCRHQHTHRIHWFAKLALRRPPGQVRQSPMPRCHFPFRIYTHTHKMTGIGAHWTQFAHKHTELADCLLRKSISIGIHLLLSTQNLRTLGGRISCAGTEAIA